MLKNQHILFYLPKEKVNRQGLAPIYCRVTVDSERVTFTTGKYINPKFWNNQQQKVSAKDNQAKLINSHLGLLINRLHETVYKLEMLGEKVTAEALRSIIKGEPKKKSKSVFEVFRLHNKKMQELVDIQYTNGTAKRYETTLSHLRDFVNCKYKQEDFPIEKVNHEFIHEWDHYMRSVRKCSNNTTVKYIKNFRKIIKLAIANSWIDKDPFANYKMKIQKVDRGYLTQLELQQLSLKHFEIQRLEQVKDVFVFQCFTGLAYCDTYKLTKDNIVGDENGVLWIKSKRTKTGTPISVPLLSSAAAIIEKYKNNSGNSTKLLPVLSNQKMNAYLKEIADICGIQKRLSCHLARHTFATTVTLANGISLESVSKMLGHSNLVTTKIYARMLDSRVLSEMQTLSAKLNAD